MARRRRNKSVLVSVLTGSWKESAFLAIMILVVMFVVIPILNNPILRSVSLILMPLALIAIGLLGALSLFKLFIQSHKTNTNDLIVREPPAFKPSLPINSPVINPQTNRPLEFSKTWSLKLIQEIEWKRFEELATAYYLTKGIRAEATSLGADGGIDIKLYQDDTGKPTSLVQCKAWCNRQVGVKEIREFLGVLTHEKIAKGFYMTSGVFSEDAIATAKANRINLMNGEMFLLMIQRLSKDSQNKLFDLATSGDYKTPSCSKCGVKMVRRKSGNVHFWGCSNFPKCHQKLYVRKSAL